VSGNVGLLRWQLVQRTMVTAFLSALLKCFRNYFSHSNVHYDSNVAEVVSYGFIVAGRRIRAAAFD
jgi:hypothetical protein